MPPRCERTSAVQHPSAATEVAAPSSVDDFGFTLLGTGSPKPSLVRSQPAVAVHFGDEVLLVDCGDGSLPQLLRAGLDPARLETVLFTHLHWDHILGYPSLVWGGWSLGRRKLRVLGPTGVEVMHQQLVADFYADQASFAETLGYPAGGWDAVTARAIEPGDVEVAHGLHIRAAHVYHPPMEAFGFRLEYRGRTLVLSGDTGYCQQLVDLAMGADVLVVDACAYSAKKGQETERLVTQLNKFHASPLEAAHMAAQAGVGLLVLTHLLADVDIHELVGICRQVYSGAICVGEDLCYYPVGDHTGSGSH